MIKIWSMKKAQQQAENAETEGGLKKKKVTAAQLRVQKGV
jgi:ubiquitin-conjugating enzyme E2 M